MNYLDTESWEEQGFAEASIELAQFKEHLVSELFEACDYNDDFTLTLSEILQLVEKLYDEHITRLAEE